MSPSGLKWRFTLADEFQEVDHRHYYGAFVLDPDGYNIEAVCHKAE